MELAAKRSINGDDSGRIFLHAFIACLLIVSLPVKNAAYMAAPAYLMILAMGGYFRCLRRTILICLTLLLVSSASLLMDVMRGKDVNAPGMLLAMVTFLPLIVILAERPDKWMDSRAFGKLVQVACWFVIIQSFIGVVQFTLSGNPDAVCGSFGLLDFAKGTITITQVFFTFTMFGMILLLMVAPMTPWTIFSVVLGLITCALAQSGHQTIFFVGSLALLGVSRVSRPSTTLITALVAGVVFAATMIAYPRTIEHTRAWYEKVVHDARSPKRMAVTGGLETLTDAKNLALGTGLGQYSSRAALITSNEYLNVSLPSVLVGRSDYFSDHIRPANRIFEDVGEGSAISKPYFSWLSFLVELGLIQSAILVAIILFAFVDNWKLMRWDLKSVARVGFVANVGILFFVLCCTIENYAEFPQAVFIPFLLYVAVRSKARVDMAQLHAAQSQPEMDGLVSMSPVPA